MPFHRSENKKQLFLTPERGIQLTLNKEHIFGDDYGSYWPESCEYEENVLDELEVEKWDEGENEAFESFDALQQFNIFIGDKRSEELAARQEAKKEQLRRLLGIKAVKEEDEASEETIITPEETVAEEREPSDSSVSQICLKEIEISDSQLKLFNLYNTYPIPEDPGNSEAFRIIEENLIAYKNDGANKFLDITQKLKLPQINILIDMFETDTINLKYYGVDSKVAQVICESLTNNTSVQTIDLTGNWLTEETCSYLGKLLMENNVIINLILSGCHIGYEGAKCLQAGLEDALNLVNLDLSYCDLDYKGLSCIAEGIINNNSGILEFINLEDNNLDEASITYLCNLITSCPNLVTLNLSWNLLYSEYAWKNLSKALSKTIIIVNLSWNGLGQECIPYLVNLLQSQNLKVLNLNGNRFGSADIKILTTALLKNKVLEELFLGNNPIRPEGVLEIVSIYASDKTYYSPLQLLDLENIWAQTTILPLLEKIKIMKPTLKINLGGTYSNYKTTGPDVKQILLNRANFEVSKSKKKQRGNFGNFIESLEDRFISRVDFMLLIKKSKLKLSETLVNEIMNVFSGPKNTVNQTELKTFYMSKYPIKKSNVQVSIKEPKVKKKAVKVI
ncbi:leucine-rich repeat-containing protein 74A-like [Prorops nasuta]|uniref:leucine-rich repeat-containing protein 74A-like n=1 Tax=Prorops nasuta TaxID=863751 RepID=UPI0034CDC54C